jgi:hypothetical protein
VTADEVDGNVVVVVWDGHGVANDSRTDDTQTWGLRLAGGRVVDGTAFRDSIAFDLWSRVQP